MISVIIPVYNVASFIRKNVRSLLGQTLEDAEFVFVDDATPDDSISIIKEELDNYPQRKNQVKIIRHDVNRGLPAARNTGMANATGEYIYHCDSDDYLEPDMLESLYRAAMENDADIAYCDFFLSFEKNERYMSNPAYSTAEEMLCKGFLGGMMKYNVWNKLIRRSLYTENSIFFPEGHSMGEDMTIIQIAAVADKVQYVPKALYHYVKLNEGAYSNSYSKQKLDDIRYNVDRTVNFLHEKFGNSFEKEVSLFKLSIKLPFLISSDRDMHQLWKAWYPEANRYVNANPDLPLRTRMLQIMAANGQWWYVSLYYKLVYKILYGVIYK